MTDTTDIAALRELLSHENLESDHHVGVTVTTLRLLLSKADTLEAERQRADVAQADMQFECDAHIETAESWREWKLRAITAEAVIAELKGKQVPVAFTGSGSLAAIKGGHEGYIWGAPADAHPVPLYDRPQKPVVLPSPYYGDRHCLDKREVIAAIEAAGGIVKDGE